MASTGKKNNDWVRAESKSAAFEKTCLLFCNGKKRMMLCAIHPDKIAVDIRIALNQIEKFPYPLAPSKCLNTGIDAPEMNAGRMILIR